MGRAEEMTTTSDRADTTDRIEKHIAVSATRSRVWRAITCSAEFGTWFRVELDGPFTAGATVRGRVTIPGYEHVMLEMQIEKIEPEGYFTITESGFDQLPAYRRAEAFRMNEAGWAGQSKNLASHVS